MTRWVPALVLLGVMTAALLYGHVTAPVATGWFWLLLVLNLATLGCYGLDKRAARLRTRRIPENTLHLLALSGGWPGALLGQQLFRHKTHKPAFRALFWLSVGANVGAMFWLHSSGGLRWLRLADSLLMY